MANHCVETEICSAELASDMACDGWPFWDLLGELALLDKTNSASHTEGTLAKEMVEKISDSDTHKDGVAFLRLLLAHLEAREPVVSVVSQELKLREVEREIAMRKRLYPRWVRDGRITAEQAHRAIGIMEAIAADYAPRDLFDQDTVTS